MESCASVSVTYPTFRCLSDKALTPISKGSSEGATLYELKSAYDYTIPPGGTELIKTDLEIEMPHGYYGHFLPSSTEEPWTHLIHMDVEVFVINEDDQNDACISLSNDTDDSFEVKRGDGVALFICKPIIRSSPLNEIENSDKMEQDGEENEENEEGSHTDVSSVLDALQKNAVKQGEMIRKVFDQLIFKCNISNSLSESTGNEDLDKRQHRQEENVEGNEDIGAFLEERATLMNKMAKRQEEVILQLSDRMKHRDEENRKTNENIRAILNERDALKRIVNEQNEMIERQTKDMIVLKTRMVDYLNQIMTEILKMRES